MLDEVSLREKFANIAGFHRVSAITGLGIPDLRVAALGLVRKLEHFGDTLPSSWLPFSYQTAYMMLHTLSEQVSSEQDKLVLARYKDAVEKRLRILERQGFVSALAQAS